MSPALITRSLFLLVPFLCCAPVSAQTTYTWTGGDVDDSWFSPLNWSAVGPGSPPPLNNIATTFVVLSGDTRTMNTLDYSFSANSLTFSATGGAFVVGTTTAETLTLGVGGITIVAGNPNNQKFNANLALGADQLWANNGIGTFTVGGAIDTAGFALTSAGTGTSTFNGIISGTGSLTKTGPGKLTLGGVNSWTGPLVVNGGGTVSIDNQTRLNSSATTPITLNNGTIEETNPGANGTFTPVGRDIILGAGGGTLSYTTAGTLIIIQTGTVISGTSGGALNKAGPGIIAVVTPATYDGPTNVLAGTLRVRTNNNVFPIGTALSVNNGATFDLDTRDQQVGSLSGTGTVNVAGGTFTVGNAASTTFSGVIANSSGAGKLNKIGSGTLTLAGANTYTGTTSISAGTLAIGTGGSLATSAVTVLNGAALAGTGTVNGTVTVGMGGIIRGGVTGGTGTLTVANSVTVNSGSVLNGTIRFEANRTGIGTADASRIALTGTGILDLNPGIGNTFTIELVKTGGTSSLNYNEQYSLVLAAVGMGGDIQLNGVTAPATIGQSDYVLQSSAFAFDPKHTLTVVSDASGKSLLLTFTPLPVPEPAAVFGLSCVALGTIGFVGRRSRRFLWQDAPGVLD